MANFRPIIISLLMLSLFVIALINVGIILGEQNNDITNIGDSTQLSSYYYSLGNNITEAYTDSQDAEASLTNSSISLTSGIPFLNAIGGIWKTIKRIPTTIYNLTIGLVFDTLLGDNEQRVIIYIISAILTISLLLGVWKLISIGDSG